MNMHDAPTGPDFDAPAAVSADWQNPAACRRRRRIILLSVLVGALFVAFLVYKAKAPRPSTRSVDAPAVTVIVPGVEPVVARVHAVGSIFARHDLPVGVAGEGGVISRIRVEAGQYVQKNQILAEIDHQVQQAQVDQLRATVANAKANAALARVELERALALVDRGFISRADIDRKTASRDSAVAQVQIAEGQLREMQERLARLFIRAPEAGLVLARQVEAGQTVSPASGALYRIAASGEMEMRAQIAEVDMAGLSVGQTAMVTPLGSKNHYAGKIWLLEPIIDPDSREGVARIALPSASDIRPGAFATAEITGAQSLRPRLPQSAILADDKGIYVMVVDGNDTVRRVPVTTGVVAADGVAITSGLSGRERVLKSAGAFFSTGEKVTPRLQPRPDAGTAD